MEDKNLNLGENANETTTVRDKTIADNSDTSAASDNTESPENTEQELGINKKALVGLGTGAAVVGSAIYLSANDGEKWKELLGFLFPNEDVAPTLDRDDQDKTGGPEKLYDEGGRVVYVKPTVNEVQLSEFGQAFKTAREAGLQQFEWQGKAYHTKLKEEMPDYIPENRDISDSEQIANLDHRLTKVEDRLDINSDSTIESSSRVASSVLDKSDQGVKNVAYGFVDDNNDGIKDTIAIDNNGDGKADAVAMDENSDGIFDTYLMNSDNNSTIDISTKDLNQDGLDVNDISETVEYEIDMNDYNEIDPNEDNTQDFDLLTNLF